MVAHVVIVQKIPHSSPASFFTVPGFPLSPFSMFHLIPFFFALSIYLRVPVLVTSCTGVLWWKLGRDVVLRAGSCASSFEGDVRRFAAG